MGASNALETADVLWFIFFIIQNSFLGIVIVYV